MFSAEAFREMKLYLACCRIQFALGLESEPSSLSHSFFLPLSWKRPDMAEILLTGTLDLSSRHVTVHCNPVST